MKNPLREVLGKSQNKPRITRKTPPAQPMKPLPRPDNLRQIPLTEVRLGPGVLLITMSISQWDLFLSEAYKRGATLLELDDSEQPIAAYRRCTCELCAQPEVMN